MGFFGGGNSSTANTTENIDARQAGGEGSTNTTHVISGTGNTLNTLDAGAVHDSLALAMAGITQANANSMATIEGQGALLSGALETQAAQQAAFTNTIENIKTADVRVLVGVGLVVVAVAGLAFLKTKKAGG